MNSILIISFGFAIVTTILTVLWRQQRGAAVAWAGIGAFVGSFIANVILIYGMTPSFTHLLMGGYPLLAFVSFGLALLLSWHKGEWSVIGRFVSVAAFILWSLSSFFVTSPGLLCDNAGADRMASMLQIREGTGIPSDTTPDTLLRVTPKTAHLKASRAISSERNLGAYLELNKTTLQKVNGEWGYAVDFGVRSWRGFRSQGGIIPGYIWVNAEDPFAEAELRLGSAMRYVPDARFGSDLERHVYINYQLEHNLQYDDLTLEIDDNGTPYYTASLLDHTVGWKGQEIVGVIVINPATGEISDYLVSQEEIPSWVDRVYSLEWVEKYAGWWARHDQYDTCQFQGEAGKKQIDRVNDVIREEGLVYQVTLTSVGADQSVTDIVYVNPRTGAATRYPLTGSTLEGVEALISEAVFNRFTPEECELHQIVGEPVWYCVLNGKGGSGGSSGSYAGVTFVQAKYSAEYTKVIRNETLLDGYNNLKRQIIAEHPDRADLEDERPTTFLWRGTLDRRTVWHDGILMSIIGAPPTSTDEPTMRWFVVRNSDQAALALVGDDIWIEAVFEENVNYYQTTGFWNYSYPPPPRE